MTRSLATTLGPHALEEQAGSGFCAVGTLMARWMRLASVAAVALASACASIPPAAPSVDPHANAGGGVFVVARQDDWQLFKSPRNCAAGLSDLAAAVCADIDGVRGDAGLSEVSQRPPGRSRHEALLLRPHAIDGVVTWLAMRPARNEDDRQP